MILFDDLADRAGILKAIQDLTIANQKFGDSSVETNSRIKKSLEDLTATLTNYLQVAQANSKQAAGLKDDIVDKTTAYRNLNTILSQSTNVVDSNNKVLDQMKDRLAALQKEYAGLDLAQKQDIRRKKEIESELTQTTRALSGLTKATNTSSKSVKAAEGSYNALKQSTADLKNQLNGLPNAYRNGTGEINKQNKAAVDLNAQYQKQVNLLGKIEKGQQVHGRNVGNYPKFGGNSAIGTLGEVAGVGTLASAAGIGAAVASAASAVLEVGQQYEKLGLLTENALQNDKKAAAEAKALIIDFANKSPLEIEEVTNAFNRLVSAGIIPTEDQLKNIADVAIAKNKTVMDYVEAIADAQQGQYRRLQEFGVNASKSGDKVIFTYNGVRTVVEDNSKAISDYLIALGKVPGIMGATDKLSQALAGRWSTLKDNIKGVANSIYQALLPSLISSVDWLGKGVSAIGNFVNGLRQMAQEQGVLMTIFKFTANPFGAISEANEANSRVGTLSVGKGTPALDAKRKREEAQQKINEAKRKAAEKAELESKNADKTLNDALSKRKAESDTKLSGLSASQQDGLISEREYIKQRQKITLDGIAERQALLAKAGKTETDDYKKLNAEKIDAATQAKRDLLKLSLSDSKADAAKAIAGLGVEKEDGSISDMDYVERKRGITVASLNEQKAILEQAGQGQSKLAKDINTQLLEADQEYYRERLKIAKAGWKDQLAEVKDGLDAIDQATAKEYEDELAKINAFYNNQRVAVKMQVAKGSISDQEGERQNHIIDINQLNSEMTAAQMAYVKDEAASTVLTNSKIALLEKYKLENGRTDKEIAEANNQITNLVAQRQKDAANDRMALDKKIADNSIQLSNKDTDEKLKNLEKEKQVRKSTADTYIQAAMALAEGLFSIEQQKTSNRLTEIDKQQAYEEASVGDNESAKAAIQKKYDVERKALQHKQDIANREQALFNIAVNTAMAIIKTSAEFPGPLGLPLEIAEAALGAVQAGIVLATPLPQYFAGKGIDGITNDNYAGPAIAGERGREIWQHNGQTTLLDEPSLINVGRNDIIYPNHMTEDILAANGIAARTTRQASANKAFSQNKEVYQQRQIAGAISWAGFPIKQLAHAIGEANQKLPFNYSTIDARGAHDYFQEVNQRTEYMNKKHRLGRR